MSLYYCRRHKKIINWNEYVSVPIKILKIKNILFNKCWWKLFMFQIYLSIVSKLSSDGEKNNKISKNKLFIHRMSCHCSYEKFINIIYWYSFAVFDENFNLIDWKREEIEKVEENVKRIQFSLFFVSIKMNLIKKYTKLRLKVLWAGNIFGEDFLMV